LQTVVVYAALVGGAVAVPAASCDALPRADPWETEAFTVWTPDMLRPIPALDAQKPTGSGATAAFTPAAKSTSPFSKWISPVTSADPPAAAAGCGHVRVLGGGAVVPIAGAVDAAMANSSLAASAATTGRGDHGAVFVVLNGANEGVWVAHDPLCLGSVAAAAADALKPARSTRRALYLYSVAGRPVADGAGVDRALRCLQLLVEGEAWVWGGVAPGFAFRVGVPERLELDGGLPPKPLLLRTLALSPRVLQAVGVLGAADSAALVEADGKRMVRSPERHYAPGFENYRTSKSAFLVGPHAAHSMVRRTSQWVARLAELEHAEWPQLLRYDPGDWY